MPAMKKTVCLLIAARLFIVAAPAQTSIQHLLTENRPDPIGLDAAMPRFSWQLISDKRNVVQLAYDIQVFDNTGKVVYESKIIHPGGNSVYPLYLDKSMAHGNYHLQLSKDQQVNSSFKFVY